MNEKGCYLVVANSFSLLHITCTVTTIPSRELLTMGRSFFRLGDDVNLEFIYPDGDSFVEPSSSETFSSSSSSSFLAIDLVNFTGRLLVSRSTRSDVTVTEASTGSFTETQVRSGSPDTGTSVIIAPWAEQETVTSISTHTPPTGLTAVNMLTEDIDTPRQDNSTPHRQDSAPSLQEDVFETPALLEEDEDAAPALEEDEDAAPVLEEDAEEETRLVSRQTDTSMSSMISSNDEQIETTMEDSSGHVVLQGKIEESQPLQPPRKSKRIGASMFYKPNMKAPPFGGKSPTQTPQHSKWGIVFAAAQMRKRMPNNVQERRTMLRESAAADPHQTRLHIQCAKSDVTLEQLHHAFMSNPEAVSIQDSRGCLPLHILANNEELVQSAHGREIAAAFALQLMRSHPESVVCKDIAGDMPFMGMIRDWLEWVYETVKRSKEMRHTNTKLGAAADRLMDRMAMYTSTKSDSRDAHGLDGNTSPAEEGKKSRVSITSSGAFPRVELWHEVEWCFSMLSVVMDELGGKSGGLHKNTRRNLRAPDQQDKICRDQIASYTAEQFPYLLKTILLLEEEGGATRRRLLKFSIFRRILVCPESVGPWLTSMLHKKGIPSIRAVDYLVLLSQTSVEDYVGGYRTILLEDIDDFHGHRVRLFDAVEALKGTIASLVVLDERETERAAATQVAWYIMSKNLGRPFVVGLVLIDFVLHITLMLAFRKDIRISPDDSGAIAAIGDEVPTQVVLFISCHYIIRKSCEAASLLNLSPRVFRSYFTDIWTLFDVLAIVLTMVAVLWHDNHPDQYRQGFNAFVLGLLWMKVLGFLKGWSMIQRLVVCFFFQVIVAN